MNNKKNNDINIELKNRPMTALDGLQLLFIGLKLAGYIDWNWWYVLIPFWISLAGMLFIAITFTFLNHIAQEDD